jgi:hypothetical protein
MSLLEVITQLVIIIETLATASLRAGIAVLSMLFHVLAILSYLTKGAVALVRTLRCNAV